LVKEITELWNYTELNEASCYGEKLDSFKQKLHTLNKFMIKTMES